MAKTQRFDVRISRPREGTYLLHLGNRVFATITVDEDGLAPVAMMKADAHEAKRAVTDAELQIIQKCLYEIRTGEWQGIAFKTVTCNVHFKGC